MKATDIDKIKSTVSDILERVGVNSGYGKIFKAIGGVEAMQEKLTPREQKILQIRFGLEDGVTHTLEEVGQEFGATRERIRQIEVRALKTLKNDYETN